MANGGSANIANSNKFNKYEDTDSGTGSSSSEAHVIRHIDRNILACQICQHRYKEPKVFKCSKVQNKRACTISKSFHETILKYSCDFKTCTSESDDPIS